MTSEDRVARSIAATLRESSLPDMAVRGARLSLRLDYSYSIGSSYVGDLRPNELIHIDLEKPQSLWSFVEDYLVPIEQALSLATGRGVIANRLVLQSSASPIRFVNGDVSAYLDDLTVLGLDRDLRLIPPDTNSGFEWYEFTNVPIPFGVAIRPLLLRWFEERDRYSVVAETFLSAGVDTLPPHARLVLLVGALEELHSTLYPSFRPERIDRDRQVREEIGGVLSSRLTKKFRLFTKQHFRPFLKERLTHMVEVLPSECQLHVVGNGVRLEHFVKAVHEQRNGVAHTGGRTPSAQTTKTLCARLELLARLTLLKDLGVEGDALPAVMARDPRFATLTGSSQTTM